jgi:hypothetical protein
MPVPSQAIPGRTENAVKNHWNATLRRTTKQCPNTSLCLLKAYMHSLNLHPGCPSRRIAANSSAQMCADEESEDPSQLSNNDSAERSLTATGCHRRRSQAKAAGGGGSTQLVSSSCHSDGTTATRRSKRQQERSCKQASDSATATRPAASVTTDAVNTAAPCISHSQLTATSAYSKRHKRQNVGRAKKDSNTDSDSEMELPLESHTHEFRSQQLPNALCNTTYNTRTRSRSAALKLATAGAAEAPHTSNSPSKTILATAVVDLALHPSSPILDLSTLTLHQFQDDAALLSSAGSSNSSSSTGFAPAEAGAVLEQPSASNVVGGCGAQDLALITACTNGTAAELLLVVSSALRNNSRLL